MFRSIHICCATALAFLCSASASATPSPGPVFHDLAVVRQLTSAYSPAQIETAYDFSPLYAAGIDGAGQSVALLEIDSFDRADLRRFDRAFNLPDPAITEYRIGGRFVPESRDETTLDVEWLHALAPGASIQVYYLDNHVLAQSSWREMASALRAAARRGAVAVSISLGACRPGQAAAPAEAALSALMAQGVAVFVASGDYGDHAGAVSECGRKIGVSYPSSDPSVVSVGGTTLKLNADGTVAAETAWRWSGGGRARPLLRPPWQVAGTLPADRYRWTPDVAFLGNQNTGVDLYFRGRWGEAGGTSLGAPAWAAIWALFRQRAEGSLLPAGAAPPLLYRLGNSPAYRTVFHDITSGSNGHYRAGPGWDPVTGWGTPDVKALVDALAGEAPLRLAPPNS